MKKKSKIFLIAMMLIALPFKQWAQTDKDHIIEVELGDISNPDFRYCLLSAIANDDNISYLIDEESSSVLLSSSNGLDQQQFLSYYDELNRLASAEFDAFLSADKERQGQAFSTWKESLPQDLFVLLFRQMLIENPSYRDGNQTCATSDPFCTTDIVTFHVDASAGGVCESGPDYGCMTPYTERPPFWFHMKIAVAGTFTIQITNSNGLDLDFCAWGPFTDPITPCPTQLTSNKIIDCDSPWNTIQECTVPSNSQVDQYYLIVITKYSSGSTDITFQKIPGSGPGETDCGILPGVANNDGPYCVGETIHLTVNEQDGATYSWTGPGGFTSTQQNPIRPNCTMAMAGTYTCVTTVGNQTTTATTEVVIYPMPTANFNFTTVCVGSATQFTSTSTTNPTGQTIQSYNWNFGDGQTGAGQNVTHTYANAGTYQVTLTVSCGAHCTDQITKTVTVYGQPTSNFTYTTVCKGTPTQFTSTATAPQGQQINSYQWNFGDGQTGTGQTVSHTYAQAGNYQVTHTVGIGGGECNGTLTQTVPVYATPSPSATAQPSIVIYGGTATLSANAGTTGQFNFHWEPADKVVNPNSQTTLTVALQQTTTFTCTVTNPQGNCTGSTQVTVSIEGSNMSASATADQTVLCEGESTTLHALPAGGTGNYTFSWTPANTLNSGSIQNPVATPPLGMTTYTCHVSDGLSATDVSVSIMVYPHTESHPVVSICPDDTYDFFGEQLSQPGPYEYTISGGNSHGCDSTIYLTLEQYESYETPITHYVCQEEYYDFYGTPVTQPDTYFHTLETVHGCDSVIVLTLLNYDRYEYTISDDFCEGSAYSFNGQSLTEPGQYVYNGQTVNGCDSIVHLNLGLSDYNTKTYNVETCGQDYTWPSNGFYYWAVGDYHVVDTVPGPYCDSIVTLNLSINAVYPDEMFEVTSCDSYTWPNVSGLFYTEGGQQSNQGKTYTESGVYTRYYQTTRGCDSIVSLNLDINNYQTTQFTVGENENCDEYYWDPQGHEILDFWGHEDPVYSQSGSYMRTYSNVMGCDSIVTMNIQLEYTPHPTDIYPMDAENTTPHWVVTATEFQINSYDFNLWDINPNCRWDTVVWTCDEAPNWVYEPFGDKGKCCKVYVLNRVEDTIWLRAHAFNHCAPDEGIEQKYWLLCSFYGVEEMENSLTNFDVIPNPNNGQMTLNFEYLTGKTNVKVYDMRGTLIDQFETYNSNGPSSHIYQMKNPVDGIYFFVATGKEGTIAKKVIIQR